MAFNRPTLLQIITRVLADLGSRFSISGTVFRRSVLGIIGTALAGAAHELHGHLDYLARQIIIDTADAIYLERWANVWGVIRKAAQFASGNVTLTGSNGSTIPIGTVIQSQDGVRFESTAAGVILGGVATVPFIAQQAGLAGSTAAGVVMTLVQPVAGVQSSVTVAAGGFTNGSDKESDDRLRQRLLLRIQSPPQGGSAADYVTWALEVPGVTRAWVYPMEMGAGTVTVRFLRDDDASIIPDTPEINAVFDYIEIKRPVTAELFVVAPVGVEQDITIQISPNTSAIRAAISAEIADMYRRDAEPGGKILISHLDEAVSIAQGEFDHLITTPEGDVTHGIGEMPLLGTITYEALA